jgi:hypothetical protein
MSPPHEAELSSPEDASSFPDPEPRDEPEELFKPARKFEGNQLPFIGFTYVGALRTPASRVVTCLAPRAKCQAV